MLYTVRLAAVSDAETIARHRAEMFRKAASLSETEAAQLRATSVPWLARCLADGSYIAWLAEHEGSVVAGGGIHLREMGPTPHKLEVCEWAHIANMYTEPSHRRRGLARRLMQTMLDWCHTRGIVHVSLGASEDGRPLYESLGFEPADHMRLPKTSAARSQS